MKKNLIFICVFTAIYCFLVFITIPFMISWGSKRNFLEKIYLIFITSPLNWETNLFFVVINGFFWGVAAHSVIAVIKYLSSLAQGVD
jgi:hypothetical protein